MWKWFYILQCYISNQYKVEKREEVSDKYQIVLSVIKSKKRIKLITLHMEVI